MIKVRDTEKLQENVINLVRFALEHKFLDWDNGSSSKVTQEFVDIFTSGCSGTLPPSDLETLVKGVQAFIRLPVYTTDQAAAWLGCGIDSVRDAVWRNGTLKSMKPGHDRLITHGWLVEYRERGE